MATQIGHSFDFDTERGRLCPIRPCVWPFLTLTFFVAKPLPTQPDGSILFCCPNRDVINVFRIQVEDG